VLSRCSEIIIAGDFNIDAMLNKKTKLSTIFNDAGLIQVIKTPTRVTHDSATLLDHACLYTSHSCRIVETLVPVYGLSDNYPTCFVHKFGSIKVRKNHHETIKYRNTKNFNQDHFNLNLESAPWSLINIFENVNDKLDIWELIFTNVLDVHAPIVKKKGKSKQLPPWMNKGILEQIRLRDKFKARASSNVLARTMYTTLRNDIVKVITNAKSAYIKEEIMKILIKVHVKDSQPFNIPFITKKQVEDYLQSMPASKATDLDGISIIIIIII
jgi:hypothetical protein